MVDLEVHENRSLWIFLEDEVNILNCSVISCFFLGGGWLSLAPGTDVPCLWIPRYGFLFLAGAEARVGCSGLDGNQAADFIAHKTDQALALADVIAAIVITRFNGR